MEPHAPDMAREERGAATPAGHAGPLLIAAAQPDGTHSGRSYAKDVRRGRLLRLRRGVYVPAPTWAGCTPTERYRLMAAAVWLGDPEQVFCRETALAIHRVPLLTLPQHIHVRTRSPGSVRVLPQVPMTGALDPAGLSRRASPEGVAGRESLSASARRGFATAKHLVLPADVDSSVPYEMHLPGVTGGRTEHLTIQTERLAVTLVDTLPRMAFADAVIAFEACLAEGRADAGEDRLNELAAEVLPARRKRSQLARVMEFCSSLSESPGESLARVRFAELGFQQPQQQKTLHIDGQTFRLDFFWEEAGIVGEFDGWVKYRAGFDEAHRLEKRREDSIRSTGLRVIRFSWEDLMEPGCLRMLNLLKRVGIPRARQPSMTRHPPASESRRPMNFASGDRPT